MSMGGLTRPQRYKQMLRSTTLRGFDGGMNVTDDDLNMSHKFATYARNVYPRPDGTISVRGGYILFKDAAASFTGAVGGIINITYFNASLISVGGNGQVLRTQANGTTTRIWDAAIAAALPGAPAPWTSGITFACFAQFNGDLIITNGVDKPIIISSTFVTTYLQDLATLTNINVPIARYVVACQRYLVMAGDPLFPNRVHISARDASGTWFGDPAPNDGTRLDVGSIVPGANIINGLLPFRDKLLVLYAEGTISGTLGIYDAAGNHTPDFNDGIKDYGCIAHKTAIAVGDDGLMLSQSGVVSIKRTLLSQSFKPENASELVDPNIADAMVAMSTVYLSDRIFAVYNKQAGQYMCVFPQSTAPTDHNIVWVYTYRPQLKQQAWSFWDGWAFKCGCVSLQGLVFFADFNSKIWAYNPNTAQDNGAAVSFDYWMPYTFLGARDLTKTSKYISLDTRGNGVVTVEMTTDQMTAPALSATFDCGDAAVVTTGRKTSDKKLFAWPAKFEAALIKIIGTSGTIPTRFVSLTIKYLTGSIRM